MSLKIQMGGLIRWPFDVDTSASEEWNAGMLVIYDTTSLKLKEITSTSNTDKVIGAVIEPKSSTTDLSNVAGSGFSGDQTRGSSKASLIMSPAILETDQMASGISFVAGERLYTNSAGKWTNVQSTDKRVLGQSLVTVNSNAVGAKLVLLYNLGLHAEP